MGIFEKRFADQEIANQGSFNQASMEFNEAPSSVLLGLDVVKSALEEDDLERI